MWIFIYMYEVRIKKIARVGDAGGNLLLDFAKQSIINRLSQLILPIGSHHRYGY